MKGLYAEVDELTSLKHLKQYLASSKHSVLAAIITVLFLLRDYAKLHDCNGGGSGKKRPDLRTRI